MRDVLAVRTNVAVEYYFLLIVFCYLSSFRLCIYCYRHKVAALGEFTHFGAKR